MKNQRENCRNSGIGGQAVLEGIMMRNRGKYAIAVRKPDGEIAVQIADYKSVIPIPLLQKIPFLRGIVNFIDSLVMGIRSLLFSASFFEEEEDLPSKDQEKKPEAKKGDGLLIAGTMSVAFLLAIGLFLLLPYLLSRFLGRNAASTFVPSVIEGIVRILIFLGYLVIISRIKDIQRTFAYHGAEHKCINCIESGKPLTVENVLSSSRLHKRCGTSFLFFVILVSVILHMFILTDSRSLQIALRFLLIPAVAGISYEIIRLAGSSSHPFVTALSKPGLALQKLTTREPDATQAEVAICAVEAVFDWQTYLAGTAETTQRAYAG